MGKKHIFSIDLIEELLIERKNSLFNSEYNNNLSNLKRLLNNRDIIILGAAGSIGSLLSSHLLTNFQINKIFLIDKNENELVDLNRKLNEQNISNDNIEYICCDINSDLYKQFINSIKSYNGLIVFYACALKHVRSAENKVSLKNMFDTNFISVLNHKRFLRNKNLIKFIYISTDKAVDPSSLMGFSKKLGELCLFYFPKNKFKFVRFANILISNGNIFDSNIKRFRENRPLSWNKGVKRVFIRRDEAIHLILLSLCLNKFDGLAPMFLEKDQKSIDLLMKKLLKYLTGRDKLSIIKGVCNKNIKLFIGSGAMNNEKNKETMTSTEEISLLDKKILYISLIKTNSSKIISIKNLLYNNVSDQEKIINIISKKIDTKIYSL